MGGLSRPCLGQTPVPTPSDALAPMTLTIGKTPYRFLVNMDHNLIWSFPCGEDVSLGLCEATRYLLKAKWNPEYKSRARGGQRIGSFYCTDQAQGQRVFAKLPNTQRIALCKFADGSMAGLETLVEFASKTK